MERIVRSMFVTTGFARSQTDSYERFMRSWVPHIIHEAPPVVVDSEITGSRHVIKRSRVTFSKPSFQESTGTTSVVYPYHCRWRNLTYTATLHVDTTHEIYDIREGKTNPRLVETRHYKELPYGEIPVMRRSSFCHTHKNPFLCNECPTDEAGTFIVNGHEKNVVGQIKMKSNAIFVWPCKQPNKQLFTAEIRSCHESKVRSTSTLTATITRHNEITVNVPFITFAIPVGVIFRALGILSVAEMERFVLRGKRWRRDSALVNLVRMVLVNNVYKDDPVLQSEEAMNTPVELHDWIGKRGTKEPTREKRVKYVEHIFGNEFLPHIGLERTKETVRRKLFMFGCVIRRLCLVRLGRLPSDDRDHVATQRVDTIGSLMAYLMRPLYRNQMKHLAMRIKKRVDQGKDVNVMELLNTKKITARFRYHFSTGNWSVTNSGQGSKGVAQMHQRMTVASGLSNLRRINKPVNKEGRLPKPRQLHPSQWGVLCCFETPEGNSCGLIENLALGAHIRTGYDPQILIDRLRKQTVVPQSTADGDGTSSAVHMMIEDLLAHTDDGDDDTSSFVEVFVNGIFIGYSQFPEQIVAFVRRERRAQNIMFDTSVAYWPQRGEVAIHTDSGALMRPCFVNENLDQFAEIWCHVGHDESLLWKELMLRGVIEYIDKDEESTLRVAVTARELADEMQGLAAPGYVIPGSNGNGGSAYQPYTHLEIDPNFIMGVVVSMLPFSEHNQAPRNVLYGAMSKQAMSDFVLNHHQRPDKITYHMWYPQRPLVRTVTENIVTKGMLSSGINANVMILIYTGFTQEDSIILRKGWVEMGASHSDLRRTYRDEEKRKGIDPTQFERPDPETCKGMRQANYDKLGADGIVPAGTFLTPGDVIVGKTMSSVDMYFGPNGEQLTRQVKRDQSQIVLGTDSCYVEQVLWTTNRDGARAVRVITRALRLPEVGDKYAMGHGQKGTVGMIVPDDEMPFLPDGRMPDVLINVHMWPSRMTIGLLCEMQLGMAAAVAGKEGNGTPFRENMTLEAFGDELQESGFNRHGKYHVISGSTGVPIEAMAYMGNCFLRRLKHLARDKAHARNTGPVQILTHQPVEGRSKEGGFRSGEMERDTFVAHGSQQFLCETLNDRSDPNVSDVCRKCGLLAIAARPEGMHIRGFVLRAKTPYCRNCRTGEHVVQVKIPYACKLLLQEIMAMGGAWRLRIEDHDEEATTTTTPIAGHQQQPQRYVVTVQSNMTQ